MAHRRGFLAEIQHQARLSEQRQRAAARQHEAAARRSAQAHKAAERAQSAAQRASEADRKRLDREAAAAHVAAMLAEVDQLNAELAATYDAVDSLLAATLDVDDYVDLETLKRGVEHPDFERADLEVPIPAPALVAEPEPPVLQQPARPKGLFGRKKKLAEAQLEAEAELGRAQAAWELEMSSLPARRQQAVDQHAAGEAARQQALALERSKYERECADREAEVAKHNDSIDQLIANLGYGAVDAVHEYVGIVLANSVYPDDFPVEHEAEFNPSVAELKLRVLIPGPDFVPTIKNYRYVKASDEITTVQLTQKDAKDRYAGIVHQVALRSLHEVFEADRRGLIRSISLEVSTDTLNPATGKNTNVLFAAVGASREAFADLDLSAVVPGATLDHLGASVSKNPLGLVAANAAGVRRA